MIAVEARGQAWGFLYVITLVFCPYVILYCGIRAGLRGQSREI